MIVIGGKEGGVRRMKESNKGPGLMETCKQFRFYFDALESHGRVLSSGMAWPVRNIIQ